MKKVFAILALAASLAACARMEQPVDETPEGTTEVTETPTTYTLTVRATKDAGTRVLELVTDGQTHRQTLKAYWEEGERVYVFVEGREVAILEAKDVDNAGGATSCTLKGDFVQSYVPSEGDELTLIFSSDNYADQQGTLKYIADWCDYAVATLTVTGVDADGQVQYADAEDGVVFENQQAIVKFTLKDQDGTAISPTAFTVMDGENAVATVTPTTDPYTTNGAGVLYVAVPAVRSGSISLSATVGDATYTYWRSGVTLEAGKYYSIAVKMDPTIDLGNTDIYNTDGIFTAQDGNILTGTSPAGNRVRIAPGATVTLRGVRIVNSENNQYDGIALDGSATINLAGENTVSADNDQAGISVPVGSMLTLQGNGSFSGPVSISDNATVTLNGVNLPKGIALAGSATINLAGENTVSADEGNAGISVPSGSTLTLQGNGSFSEPVCISDNATVTLNGVTLPKGIELAGSATINLVGENTVSADGGNAGISVPSGSTLTLQGNGSLTATGGWGAAGIGGNTIVSDGVTFGGSISERVQISSGATVTLNGATLPKGIALAGSATINLAGENTVSADGGNAGISVPSGSTLTLQGNGSLTATGGWGAAGIGGNASTSCGDISISGGTVEATGGWGAAGIGGGFGGPCGDISIDDADVTAYGGDNGAGIGGGYLGSCGPITISGYYVEATGGVYAAGIGGGNNGSCGDITISMTRVMATKGDNAEFSIGSGLSYLPFSVTINGFYINNRDDYLTTSPLYIEPWVMPF